MNVIQWLLRISATYPNCSSNLLIRFLYTGNQLVHGLIGAQFYIPKVSNLIKFNINRCKVRVIYKQKSRDQLMGIHPDKRVSISRPLPVWTLRDRSILKVFENVVVPQLKDTSACFCVFHEDHPPGSSVRINLKCIPSSF